jgi:uncharacterized protein (DUF2141 family)
MQLVKKSQWALAAALVAAAIVLGASAHVTAAQQVAGELKVTIDYKGAGTVDKTHQVFVWVFDTPDISASSTPIASDVVTANGASVSFSGLPKTVYLAAAFNEKGDYDGTQGPPPSGTPITIYGSPGPATGVTTGGPEAVVTVTFDDSVRMP